MAEPHYIERYREYEAQLATAREDAERYKAERDEQRENAEKAIELAQRHKEALGRAQSPQGDSSIREDAERYRKALETIAAPPKYPRSTGMRLMEGDDAREVARAALNPIPSSDTER